MQGCDARVVHGIDKRWDPRQQHEQTYKTSRPARSCGLLAKRHFGVVRHPASISRLSSLRQQFRQIPNVVGQIRLHRRGDPDAAVNAAEIVIGEVQAVGRPQVLPLLAEPIRQPRQSAHLQSNREVLALHMRRADLLRIGIPHDWDPFRVRHVGRAVAAALFFRGLGIDLDQLCKSRSGRKASW